MKVESELGRGTSFILNIFTKSRVPNASSVGEGYPSSEVSQKFVFIQTNALSEELECHIKDFKPEDQSENKHFKLSVNSIQKDILTHIQAKQTLKQLCGIESLQLSDLSNKDESIEVTTHPLENARDKKSSKSMVNNLQQMHTWSHVLEE